MFVTILDVITCVVRMCNNCYQSVILVRKKSNKENKYMSYQHHWLNGQSLELPAGKAVCVGRNYVAHIQELNNLVPDEPLLFMKPNSSFQALNERVQLNAFLGEHHYEAELVLLVGEQIDHNTVTPLNGILGVGLGLDLTLRDVQTKLKTQGYPWERAKAYDGSCVLTPFLPIADIEDVESIEYRFWINNEQKQVGKVPLMIKSLGELLVEISKSFTLYPGDIVMTGTPEGVGQLHHGDHLQLQIDQHPISKGVVSIV